MTVLRRLLVLPVVAIVVGATLLALSRPAGAADCPSDANADAVRATTVVLLVHGFTSSADTWGPTRSHPGSSSLYGALSELGSAHVATFDYSDVADHWVTDRKIGPALAGVIKCYADASAVLGTGKIVLVAHSMGGLAIRCALAESCGRVAGNVDRVGMVVTMGTPNTGSYWQVPHSGVAQDATFGSLGAFCWTVSWAELRQNDLLNSMCTYLHSLATSDAAHGFIQGSDELKALPRWPSRNQVPVHALAGSASFGTEIFFYHSDPAPAGDLVVGIESATTSTVDQPPIVIDCGTWYVKYLSPWPLGLQQGTCWHGSETSARPFVLAATGLVSDYIAVHGCGGGSTAPEVKAAVRRVPSAGYPWSTQVGDYSGNFDRCADLSAVVLPIKGGSISSPRQVLLFHKGAYIGTGTTDAWPMASLNTAKSTYDTVTVDYSYLRRWDPDLASASGRASLSFHWTGQQVQMQGDLPPDMTDPPPLGALISIDGFGPAFEWGASRAEAEAALGSAFVEVQDLGGGCQQASLPGYSGVTFGIQDGKVSVAAVGNANSVGMVPTTDTGLTLGDSVSRISAAYSGVVVDADPSDAATSRYTYSRGGRTAQFLSFDQSSINWMQFGLTGSVGEAPCV